MSALSGEGRFRDRLAADPEVSALLTPEDLARCFDLEHALRHVNAIIDRALAAE
jgi:adenylosuccinate lyase